MSYLHLPRIVFTGDFLSDVSTINNDVSHYNVDTFRPSFQKPNISGVNGWWNPEGGASFDFKDCQIQKICYSDGTTADSSDMNDLIGEFIRGAEGRSPAKMVDLDPQQQLVSELWAVQLRIVNKAGDEVLSGDLVTTAFKDVQMRQTDGAKVNLQPLGASWTTVLENLVWGESSDQYRILKDLKAVTHDNRLSLNLNGFAYNKALPEDSRFSLGKMLGGIGPWFRNEPETFVAERRLFATKNFAPGAAFVSYFTTSNFRFDTEKNLLSIDFGNSMPVGNELGDVTVTNQYVLAVSKYSLNNAPNTDDFPLDTEEFNVIGDLPYSQGNWLLKTGGIVDMNISQDLADQLKNNQLLLLKKIDDNYTLIARESFDGLNVRADNMVQRIDTGDKPIVYFFASQWGEPLPTGSVSIHLAPPTATAPGAICPTPGNNYPIEGLSFDSTNVGITNGKGELTITGNRIDKPRVYIDGQIYFVEYELADSPTDYADLARNFLSVHLRDYYVVPDKPKWSDIQETMQQFSNLYPIMSKYLVDLGDREALLTRKDILLFAFNQDINSPMYMPVTRDLSETKRITIVKWLESNGKWDNEDTTVSGPSALAAHAMKTLGKHTKDFAKPPAGTPDKPSDFHVRLMTQMRVKMGEQLTFIEIEDLTKI